MPPTLEGKERRQFHRKVWEASRLTSGRLFIFLHIKLAEGFGFQRVSYHIIHVPWCIKGNFDQNSKFKSAKYVDVKIRLQFAFNSIRPSIFFPLFLEGQPTSVKMTRLTKIVSSFCPHCQNCIWPSSLAELWAWILVNGNSYFPVHALKSV